MSESNSRTVITTADAPAAIGTYSQAVRVGSTVYLSGQIPLNPATMELVGTDIDAQIHQVFKNLCAVATAAGGTFEHVAKLTVYLTSLTHFARVNAIMAEYFATPYPARAAVGVAELPRGAHVEIDAILVLPDAR
jgi:reactive intermediate/imine deaminase